MGRPRLRRALRALAVCAVSLAVVALLALVLVHTPAGRSAARGALESWGSRATGGTLRLGGLDLALWRGEAVATAASLTRPGLAVDVQRVTLDWSPTRGPHLTLLRPRILVRDTDGPPRSSPAQGLAAHPWQALERFDRLQVVEGRLEIQDARGAPWLVLGRFDLDGAGGSPHVTVRVTDAACGWPGAGLRVQGIAAEADVRLEEGLLALERARVIAGTSTIDVSGRLSRIEPISASASARAAADGALIEDLSPGSGLEGPIGARADVDVVSGRVTGTLDASSTALALAGVGPWSATGHGRFDGRLLILDAFAADGFGGRIEASGPLALGSQSRTEVDARAQGLDVAALVRALGGGADVPVSARASGTLAWSTQGWDIASSRGEARIALAPGGGRGLRPSGEAVVRLRGRELAIDEARVEARGALATAHGRIGPGGAIEGRWAADLPLAAATGILADLGSSAQPPPLSGRVRVEGDLAGSVAAPRSAATVRSEGLAISGEPLGLSGALRYDAGRLSLAPLALGSGAGHATLTGGVPFVASGEWDVAGAIEALETRPLQRLLGIPGHGAAMGTLRVTGRRDDPQGRVALRGTVELPRPEEPATADGVAVDLEAESSGRRVQVSRLAVDLAGGRVSGQARYDGSSGAFETKLEVERVAWDRVPLLAAPARRLHGTVAGRVALAGTTDAPSGDVQLTLAEGTIDGVALPPLSLGAQADGRALKIEGAAGEVFLRGQGSLDGDWPLRLDVDTAHLPLQALADALAPASVRPLAVTASGTLALSLPLRHPSQVTYASTSLSASGRIRRVEWTLAPLAFEGDRTSVSVEGLRLSAGKASLSASGRVALDDTSPVALEVEADLDLADLDPGLAGRSLAGTSRLRLSAAGTRKAPELSGTLTLADVRGNFEEALLGDLDLEARFVGRDLEVDRLTAELLGGTATAQGRIPLVPRARRRAGPVHLRAAGPGPRAPAGRGARRGWASARAARLAGGRGRGGRARARVAGRARTGHPPGDAVGRGRAGSRRARRRHARSRGASRSIRCGSRGRSGSSRPAPRPTSPPGGRAGPRHSPATSTCARSRRTCPAPRSRDSARIDARVLRADGSWRLDGGVQVERARLSLDALNFALGDLTGALRFEGDRIALDVTGAAGDGTLRAKGGLRLGPALLGAADVTLEAERCRAVPAGPSRPRQRLGPLTGGPGDYRLAGR